MKKYFLKDATLKNVDGDQFRYQDFANNLRKIIECNKTPFNIAIVGKWGLGKSSLINMALAPLSKKEDIFQLERNAGNIANASDCGDFSYPFSGCNYS